MLLVSSFINYMFTCFDYLSIGVVIFLIYKNSLYIILKYPPLVSVC